MRKKTFTSTLLADYSSLVQRGRAAHFSGVSGFSPFGLDASRVAPNTAKILAPQLLLFI